MNLKNLLIPILVLYGSGKGFSQNITYNHLVDSTNVKTQKVMTLFENYIHSREKTLSHNPFWSAEEQKTYKHFDFLESEFKPSLYMGFPVHVLSIKNDGQEYEIKAQFTFCQENQVPYVLATVNYVAKLENGEYKLFNVLPKNRKRWKSNKIGLINYYYPDYHEFKFEKAEKANEFINRITDIFDVDPIPFEYYMADDYDEIQRIKGFDYYIGMGGRIKPSGKAAYDKIYCAGLGEDYLHEIFHVQIDQHYPDKYYWVTEGVATFVSGASRGRPLAWHFDRLNKHLQDHPEIDLDNLLDFVNLDEYTDYHYGIGSLIVKKVYEKGGWDLVKELMKSGDSKEDYYKAIENLLGVSQQNLNEYLREQLRKESEGNLDSAKS